MYRKLSAYRRYNTTRDLVLNVEREQHDRSEAQRSTGFENHPNDGHRFRCETRSDNSGLPLNFPYPVRDET